MHSVANLQNAIADLNHERQKVSDRQAGDRGLGQAGADLRGGQHAADSLRKHVVTQSPAQKALEAKETSKAQLLSPAVPSTPLAAARDVAQVCAAPDRNTDRWGEVLKWGGSNRVESAGDCCKMCAEFVPEEKTDFMECNVWVYCEDQARCKDNYKSCWLKHLPHPDASRPRSDPLVPWTSGIISPALSGADLAAEAEGDRSFHTVITAQGAPTHWQSRVGYYWFLKTKRQCQAAGKCEMGGFTRVLHSGEPDDLMQEIPTFVAQTLPPEHPDHGYVVLNRPYALLQWIRQATIPEKYVLMSEPDHLWLRPMANLMKGTRPAAFPFFYIEPSKKSYLPIVQKFTGPITRKEAEQIAPIGNAPTLMSLDDLTRVFPVWFNLSIAIHNDEQAAKEWGWVQEMYAFTIASYNAGVRNIGLHPEMAAQPPYDTKLADFYILHYTYGNDYDLNGTFTPGRLRWGWAKLAPGDSTSDPTPKNRLPRNLGPPPMGMKNELVRRLVDAINEASGIIPGWDEYAETGVAKALWDGKTFAS
ncbi:hypothetical protein QBZ16_003033 [Prototheca wickerhamii]|uniref:Apple domain-containing protein n=1 Tax=Prototheca wickerhamii TaxID=3111 RepID=A0AAD9IN18_PROWI|nr:hypothetical protein QBZ16_003033 [Prototheca wickerhamii]